MPVPRVVRKALAGHGYRSADQQIAWLGSALRRYLASGWGMGSLRVARCEVQRLDSSLSSRCRKIAPLSRVSVAVSVWKSHCFKRHCQTFCNRETPLHFSSQAPSPDSRRACRKRTGSRHRVRSQRCEQNHARVDAPLAATHELFTVAWIGQRTTFVSAAMLIEADVRARLGWRKFLTVDFEMGAVRAKRATPHFENRKIRWTLSRSRPQRRVRRVG
jgi:hypothetical protein